MFIDCTFKYCFHCFQKSPEKWTVMLETGGFLHVLLESVRVVHTVGCESLEATLRSPRRVETTGLADKPLVVLIDSQMVIIHAIKCSLVADVLERNLETDDELAVAIARTTTAAVTVHHWCFDPPAAAGSKPTPNPPLNLPLGALNCGIEDHIMAVRFTNYLSYLSLFSRSAGNTGARLSNLNLPFIVQI